MTIDLMLSDNSCTILSSRLPMALPLLSFALRYAHNCLVDVCRSFQAALPLQATGIDWTAKLGLVGA